MKKYNNLQLVGVWFFQIGFGDEMKALGNYASVPDD